MEGKDSSLTIGNPDASTGQHIVYLPIAATDLPSQIRLGEVWAAMWRAKWTIVIGSLVGMFIVALALFQMQPRYASSVTMMYSQGQEISYESTDSSQSRTPSQGSLDEALAILRSRSFNAEFIKERDIIDEILPPRQSPYLKWLVGDQPKTLQRAVTKFDKDVREIVEDRTNGVIKLSIVHKDPATAADWSNDLIYRLNQHIRQRDKSRAETSIGYLRSQIAATDAAELEVMLYSLIEEHMKLIAFAEVTQEYAFTVIDEAIPAEQPTLTNVQKLFLSVLVGVAVGFVISVLILFRTFAKAEEDAQTESAAPEPAGGAS